MQIYIIVLILDVGDDRLYVFKNEIDAKFLVTYLA